MALKNHSKLQVEWQRRCCVHETLDGEAIAAILSARAILATEKFSSARWRMQFAFAMTNGEKRLSKNAGGMPA